MADAARALLRWLALVLLAALVVQVFFVLRIAAMAWWDPGSTTVQRSQAWQLAARGKLGQWRHGWLPYESISPHLKRAVIAAEDGRFFDHSGVEWDAVEKAWQKNERARQQAEDAQRRAAERAQQAAERADKRTRAGGGKPAPVAAVSTPPLKSVPAAKIVGGSTITQQLAKNLLLSGERTLLRKGQELLLTWSLELLLDKRQILGLYLNHVEWGEGVFGAEAAAQRYFRKSARNLSPAEAARLAVMLPRPRYFERQPQSAYLAGRSRTIQARMGAVELP